MYALLCIEETQGANVANIYIYIYIYIHMYALVYLCMYCYVYRGNKGSECL